jgi:hypothetical protein
MSINHSHFLTVDSHASWTSLSGYKDQQLKNEFADLLILIYVIHPIQSASLPFPYTPVVQYACDCVKTSMRSPDQHFGELQDVSMDNFDIFFLLSIPQIMNKVHLNTLNIEPNTKSSPS